MAPPGPLPAPAAVPAELAAMLREAAHVAVLTGAGISAESGVPTFRDAQTGLWAQFDPSELATPRAFARRPRFVWDWYAWRRELISQAQPNPAHHALVTIEQRVPAFTLITQNVDGLHAAAGSRQVIELHGNIRRVRCSRGCGVVERWEDGPADEPPRCPQCRAFLRPDVVWFEEMLPPDALAAAGDAVDACDLLLVVGTAAEVYPAAALPLQARRAGARVIEINPNETALSADADYMLRGPAGTVLPQWVAAAWPV